ncbi:ABC transporter ATP-binding protein [Actinoalloteichus hymeniacidonis]|uniref:ABC-type antimicrobial peptide transport system, ATPase component n=1 Tax=Actinoalloteichus hymeniacidonis TaxID=340345 RepID=A0AAC9HQS1_9PSEU|nr:ATP-binding cassette domain-containing protein [Actinoalloteichus hymeniacidonis]AOS63246.1 ABC-type antimicrobial peptide transport system, ATPase component [Actinoalloteichus hymeniacidonis]MBB5908715.1 putative ABC transport system ATP-binding protein/macrolide transport system ATP-binding/permease protein [Actinoalloteichus hymeniacidonis]
MAEITTQTTVTAESVLGLRAVSVTYPTPSGPVEAVRGVTLDVPNRGLTVLAGPSGSGKSTLLRVLALLDKPTEGQVLLRDRELGGLDAGELRRLRRSRIALVYQNPAENLFDYLTVAENLRAAAQLADRPDPGEELLEQLGLPGTGGWRIRSLSGGQQQRLALACTLAMGCEVVLADEPTSQLDARSADLVLDALRRVTALDVPVVVASHDERLRSGADTLVWLRDGELTAIEGAGR